MEVREYIIDDEREEADNILLEIIPADELEEVVKDLKGKYEKAKADMDGRNRKIAKWRKYMEAIASDAPKNHPFKNSSNVTVPVTQTVTQSLDAQVRGMFMARDPLLNVEPMNTTEENIRHSKVIEKYLNLLLKNPYDVGMDWLSDLSYETLLCGGSFPVVSYEVNQWRVKDVEGKDQTVIWHDGPAITVVPLERVIYPRGVPEISRLPWIAIDKTLTASELRERAARGIYDADAVAKVLESKRTSPTELEEQEQVAEYFNSSETTDLYDISEVYFYYDVAGDGIPVDLFFTIHFPSGAVLKQQYNTIGARCIVNAKYIHRPQSLTGRGTGQMTESFQEEITTNHNLRIDNAKVAGMRMLAVKKGSWQTSRREVYPGAVWEFENPREDIQPIQLGEVYPSSLSSEQLAWQLTHRATGLSEAQMGFADSTLGTRDTYRGQQLRMQRGDTILGSAVERLKTTISRIGMLVWLQCVANKDRVIAREMNAKRLTEEELAILREALEMPLAEVPMRLKFIVRTTEAEKTYEQRRMNIMTLSQLYSQFAQQTIPLAMQLYGPQGMQIQQQAPELWAYLGRILTGSGKLMEEIFKFFGTMDVNNYVPDPEKLDKLLDMLGAVAQGMQGMPQLGVIPSQSAPHDGILPQGNQPQGEAPQEGAMPGEGGEIPPELIAAMMKGG